MTTKPFLYLDLSKGWREDQHPRDKHGKFTTVKGGSRVVTKHGKTGVVTKVAGDKYHLNYDDGSSGAVIKENALHEKDHAKVEKAKKAKKRKAKKAGKKQSATKAKNKANGTAKAKPIKDPTSGEGAKKSAKKPTSKTSKASKSKPSKKSKQGKKSTNTSSKTSKEKVITNYESGTSKKRAGKIEGKNTVTHSVKEQQKGGQEYKNAEKELPKKNSGIDEAWNSKEVQNLMKKPINKRSPKKVRELAGKITEENDKLAHSLVNRRLKAMGLPQRKNKIGTASTKNPFVYETGLHGDMLQSARGAMYETLLATMAGSQTPGSAIGAHVVNRMKDKISKDLYGMLNTIPAPHEIRGAIRDMKRYENELSQQIGRSPSDEELGAYLQASSKHFQEAPINVAPRWDDKTGEWKASKDRIEDPAERLKMLRQYDAIQRTASADSHIGKEGEKEVTIADNAVDEERSPEESYIRKERQKELEGTLPNAMRQMKMSEASIKVWTLTHSGTSGNRGHITSKEVAEMINNEGGWKGKKISDSWVRQRYKEGREAINEAVRKKHPAVEQLKLLKSFIFNLMLKAVYEYNLVKSLHSWGFDHTVLRTEFVRTATGRNLFDIKKSLSPTEYIGSYVTVDSGQVHARIVEHALPKGQELTKAFQDFEELQKALFAHKDGGNNAINQKATEYVKKNSGKYQAMAKTQQDRVRAKSGQLTWSEQLLLDNKGTAWITWGGKKILIHGETGEIKYDSRNEAHREDQAKNHDISTQEDKLDFHHEADIAEDRKKELMEQAQKDHEAGNYTLKGGRSKAKWAEHHGVKMKEVEDEKGKKDLVPDLDEDGNLQHDFSKHDFTDDHGAKAFEEGLGDLKNSLADHKKDTVTDTRHKLVSMHHKWDDDKQDEFHKASDEDRAKTIGDHMSNHEELRNLLERAHKMKAEGKKGKDIQAELAPELKELAKHEDVASVVGVSKKIATVFNGIKKDHSIDDTLTHIGKQELSRAQEEANKKMLPEGHYEIGNKKNGKSMVVEIGHRKDPDTGVFMSYVKEAFDPKTGKHFTSEDDIGKSWGQLGRALGMNNNSAESFIYNSNSEAHDAVVQPMDSEEAKELRKNTTLGMRDSMIHKEFSKVDQTVDKDGKLQSTTYAQDMPDGTQNAIEVDKDGKITDPIMARLIQSREPITNADELHNALQNAVGNTAWVTTHMGSDVHVGDALGHHVKLQYDGKGAPKVVGGQYDGYRFMDSKDVPKGAIDPATGEPIKTLFNNGKLVDRKFTTKNEVPMKKGNAVMYPDGDGFKKGKIKNVREDGTMEVHNSKGQLVGLFKKNELKPAKEEGRTLANSGQAVLHLKENKAHTMNTAEAFGDNNKAKNLFQQALEKAGIKGAIDKETGELNKDLELNGKEHQALRKILGRSKAGKAILNQFEASNRPSSLELHVPEHLRADVEAEGVKVGKDGKAEISAGKFEHLRDILGGMSVDHKAQDYMKDHFKRKDRTPKPTEELKKDYQPFKAEGAHAEKFRKQFKDGSFLSQEYLKGKGDPKPDGKGGYVDEKGKKVDKDGYQLNDDGSKKPGGLYNTQLEGLAHLVERGRGIAGHGMGTGKTILGVMAGLHHKATQESMGRKAGKTLIVAPKGIMSDWGKEIGEHTNSKALYVGSGFDGAVNKPVKVGEDKDGNPIHKDRKHWGQKGTEQEAVDFKSFKKNGSHANEDHDFHVVSYDTFMRNKDHFANSGVYDNIAIDEIHAFKNQGGKRGGSLADTTNQFKNVWGLSGTPMENDAREIHSLIDTVTGGKHELGSKKEFVENYMVKDRKGKIVGVKPEDQQPEPKLGDVMANVVQFRSGEDVRYNDGSNIHFPHLSGGEGTANNPNPKNDFVGNLTDRSRDHRTTDYYGTKHSVTDFEKSSKEVTTPGGDKYSVDTHVPKGVDPNSSMGKMYSEYSKLQQKYLPDSKLRELQTATATGFDNASGKKSQNYLTAMQKLQKYINAPGAHKMYVPGGGNAIESDATNAQAEAPKDKKKSEPIPHEIDENGNKRYYESDGKGGYLKNADGSPKLLDPLHHNNPKAQYLKQRVSNYLDQVQAENKDRRASGKPEIMPKVVVKSAYTTFGTDIVDGVLRDLHNDHPELQRWKKKVGDKFSHGRFTGDAGDREGTKTGFRGNKKNYAKEQGHLWATTVSPAGKEGVDFGNAHYMVHYDQEWNPQKMAQFTARVRRSDSAKTHAQVDRANTVRVESLHMPGTVEDFMFDAQDKKMESINQVTTDTRNAEQMDKLGDTQGGVGRSHRGFTRGKSNKAGAKPKKNVSTTQTSKPKKAQVGGGTTQGKAVAKGMKLVVLL